MEKIEEVEVKVINKEHIFYCDGCGNEILRSIETAGDDYYERPKRYYIQHAELKGDYCKECASKKIRKVINLAIDEGFDIKECIREL